MSLSDEIIYIDLDGYILFLLLSYIESKMSDIQSQLQEIVPRAAIYKGTNKSIDSTVHKVEYVTYPSNLSHVLEVGSGSSEQKVHFHISGNCLLDGKNSYFSVQLKTNKWTSCLSGDITSLFKRVTISLPSSGNQILEDIQEYNVLSSMVQYMSASSEDLESNWYSGQSSMFGNTREENLETSRLDLNWNAGTDGWRTYTCAGVPQCQFEGVCPGGKKKLAKEGKSQWCRNF